MKRLSISIFIALTIFIIFATIIPVQGNFNEDFNSISSLDNWTLFGKDFNAANNGVVPDFNPTWILSDNTLMSGGERSSTITLNYACHAINKNDAESGRWSFDVFGSNNFNQWGFRITKMPQYTQSEGYNLSNEYIQYLVNGHDSISYLDYKLNTSESYISTLGTEYLSSNDVEGWHSYAIERVNSNIYVFRDGKKVNDESLPSEVKSSYESLCVWTEVGDLVKFDNIGITAIKPNDEPNSFLENLWPIALFGSIGLGSAFVWINYISNNKKLKNVTQSGNTTQQILKSVRNEFNLSDLTLLSLIGQYKIDQKYKEQDFKDMIPQELVTFRYLMHPIRLTIMKLLDSQEKMKSIEIKHILDLSWGEYGNHIKSLEEKGYVELVDEFNEDGHVSQTVYILEEGRNEFHRLFILLEKFVSSHSPYGKIISQEKFSFGDDPLYPKE